MACAPSIAPTWTPTSPSVSRGPQAPSPMPTLVRTGPGPTPLTCSSGDGPGGSPTWSGESMPLSTLDGPDCSLPANPPGPPRETSSLPALGSRLISGGCWGSISLTGSSGGLPVLGTVFSLCNKWNPSRPFLSYFGRAPVRWGTSCSVRAPWCMPGCPASVPPPRPTATPRASHLADDPACRHLIPCQM